MSQVHSQGERYVQQGRLIALTGQAGAKNGSNSNRLREIGAESKIPAILIAAKTELDLEMLRDENHRPCRRHRGIEILVEDVIQAYRHSIPVELTNLPAVTENVVFKLPAGLNDRFLRGLTVDATNF
ncbi:MAG: hypothetical protein WBE80_11760 [Methylocella sp.]